MRWMRNVVGGGVAALALYAGTVQAYTLSVYPAAQTVGVGQQASVDVRIADVLPLGLGAYDFDVLFDGSLLAFDQIVDGMGLGLSIGVDAMLAPGLVHVSDFSLSSVADLLAVQTNDFVIFTLLFDALAPGTSALTFSSVTLGDAAANPVGPADFAPGSITILAISEPHSLALVVGCLAALALQRRRSQRAFRRWQSAFDRSGRAVGGQ